MESESDYWTIEPTRITSNLLIFSTTYTPVFEPHGGVDPDTVRMLEAFANAIVDNQAEGTGKLTARRRRREAYLCVWRTGGRTLALVELMEGRVRWRRQHQLDQLVINPGVRGASSGTEAAQGQPGAWRSDSPSRMLTGAARDDG